ncbi:UDP-3-O-(3-hydroxymyristoyl)glucosamine N-acyltransferase [Alphaproteobacteria bacterium]|nr:UDP-3-O-(3-hydroxymyristoyl)glucosamine N-acyltransferase [Alphaproteobacteria bacterium]
MNFKNYERNTFFDINKKITVKYILSDISLVIKEKILTNFIVSDVSTPDNLKNNSIIFLKKEKIKSFTSNNISLNLSIHAFVETDEIIELNINSYTLVNNLISSYNNIINNFIIHPDHFLYKDKFFKKKNSFISSKSKINKSVKIGNNCVIGKGVIIGKNCIIKDNVIIKNSILEENIIINENCVIGSNGFGFDPNNLSNSRNEPQIGIVYICNNSSIGSSSTIDRGKINYTLIGESCMLDNQVHIAHNVILGKNVIIAAQSGVAGSTKIGDNVTIGGQAGISGHLNIGNNVIIGAKSGVTKNIPNNSVVAGFPAIDIKKWKKMIINQRKF